MGVVPEDIQARIEFFEQHTGAAKAWATRAAQIGLLPADVTAADLKVVACRAAYENQKLLQQQARAATLGLRATLADMSTAGAELIRKIRVKAQSEGGGPATDHIYELAEMPAPSTPSPAGPPGDPYKFVVKLENTGAVTMSFKCDNPKGTTGTIYQVARQLGGTGPFVNIGAVGVKKFTDESLPVGTGTVVYRVFAQRSTARGNAVDLTVKFGTTSAGMTTLSFDQPTPSPRMAA